MSDTHSPRLGTTADGETVCGDCGCNVEDPLFGERHAMSDTPGAVRQLVEEVADNPYADGVYLPKADAHDAEDARRADEADRRAVRLNLMISERDAALQQARELLRRLDEWDQMRMGTGDEPYWRREIATVLAAIDALEVR